MLPGVTGYRRAVETLAEAAVGATGPGEYRRESLRALQRHLGFDFGISWTSSELLEPGTIGVGQSILQRFLENKPRYVPELRGVLRQAASREIIIDKTIYGPEKEKFAFYREIVGPLGAAHGMALAVAARGQVLSILRLGRGGPSPFAAKDVEKARALLPILRVCELMRLTAPARDESPTRPLSSREGQLIDLFATGCTYADAARALGISLNTVRVHVRRAFQKLGVASKAEAVATRLRGAP
jgi:DNA-binding NarL/FixJ family response regulator